MSVSDVGEGGNGSGGGGGGGGKWMVVVRRLRVKR